MRRRLLTFVALALAASAVRASTLEGAFDRTFDVRPGTLFALDNTNGRITIHSWDEPRVRVHAVKRVESRDSAEATKAFNELLIIPAVTSDALRIQTKYPRRNDGLFDWLAGTSVNTNVEYDITVPRAMNLEIDNTNGSIHISDVSGSTHVSNTNGPVECNRCSGDVDAETTNGRIRADLTAVNAGRPIRLETTNGRVTVSLPKSAGVRVDASTTNGSIESDLPVTTTEVRSHALRGTINGGGAEVRLRTTNGSISIETR